jgi:hypothetical protein
MGLEIFSKQVGNLDANLLKNCLSSHRLVWGVLNSFQGSWVEE